MRRVSHDRLHRHGAGRPGSFGGSQFAHVIAGARRGSSATDPLAQTLTMRFTARTWSSGCRRPSAGPCRSSRRARRIASIASASIRAAAGVRAGRAAPATQRTGAFKHSWTSPGAAGCGVTRVAWSPACWRLRLGLGFPPGNRRRMGAFGRRAATEAAGRRLAAPLAELDAVQKLLASRDPLALRAVAGSAIPVGDTTSEHLLMGTEWKGELDFRRPSVLIPSALGWCLTKNRLPLSPFAGGLCRSSARSPRSRRPRRSPGQAGHQFIPRSSCGRLEATRTS